MEAATATLAVPDRSIQQRMEALATANRIRSKRKVLKAHLKQRTKTPREVLLDPPEFAHTMKVFDLIVAAPKYGRVKANKVLVSCRISPSKTLGGLTERQRRELASVLG
jgi:hypothetical protein